MLRFMRLFYTDGLASLVGDDDLLFLRHYSGIVKQYLAVETMLLDHPTVTVLLSLFQPKAAILHQL